MVARILRGSRMLRGIGAGGASGVGAGGHHAHAARGLGLLSGVHIVGLTAFAAIITPSGDPFSMLALAIPLYIFYEASIIIGKVLLRRRTPAE